MTIERYFRGVIEKSAAPVFPEQRLTPSGEKSKKPRKVIEIANAIRRDDPQTSDEKAYRIAWAQFKGTKADPGEGKKIRGGSTTKDPTGIRKKLRNLYLGRGTKFAFSYPELAGTLGGGAGILGTTATDDPEDRGMLERGARGAAGAAAGAKAGELAGRVASKALGVGTGMALLYQGYNPLGAIIAAKGVKELSEKVLVPAGAALGAQKGYAMLQQSTKKASPIAEGFVRALMEKRAQALPLEKTAGDDYRSRVRDRLSKIANELSRISKNKKEAFDNLEDQVAQLLTKGTRNVPLAYLLDRAENGLLESATCQGSFDFLRENMG